MKTIKCALAFVLCIFIGVPSFAANVANVDSEFKGAIRAVKGTDTVVAGLPLNEAKTPDRSLLKLKIVIYPGQKIVLAGPDKFDVLFKNKKSPNKKIRNSSSDGVVIIKVPRDLLDRPEYKEELAKNGSVKFNFGVRSNQGEIDPEIIVIRRL